MFEYLILFLIGRVRSGNERRLGVLKNHFRFEELFQRFDRMQMIHDDRLRCFFLFDRLARRLLYGENAARRSRIVVRLFSTGKKISRCVIGFE